MSSILIAIIAALILVLASTNSLRTHQRIGKPEIPPQCLDKGYCEHVPNYPTEYAASLIAKLKKQGAIDRYRRVVSKEESFSPNNIILCPYKTAIVTPQAVRSSDGEWHFILNQQIDPIQQFAVKDCKKQSNTNGEDMKCESYIFMSGATAVCRQKKVTITLSTFDKLGRKLRQVPFEVNCCCSCEART